MVEPADSAAADERQVIVGKISGVYGVSGWVKLFSYTRPKENIFNYSPWQLQPNRETRSLLEGREHGKTLIARLEGIEDRDAARRLQGSDITISRDQLPEPGPGEYYWYDLLGLDVVDTRGAGLGKVMEIRETGANDILIIKGKRRYLVPLVMDEVVKEIDLENRRITVDWIPD